MDDMFEHLTVPPDFRNLNLRPYGDGKIIKRISKHKNTDNIYKLRHP